MAIIQTIGTSPETTTLAQIRGHLYPKNTLSFWSPAKESSWRLASETRIQELISDGDAKYVSALNRPEDYSGEERPDDSVLPYIGPLYFDFDGDLEIVIRDVIAFGRNLEKRGVNPDQVRWYATGGRGFHAEISSLCFVDGGRVGNPFLPQIYREIALALALNTMDMAVYSTRKGRMWRTPNVQRENGKYKVPVTWSEILTITPATYADLCSAPRPYPPIQPLSPVTGMAILYSSACDKVTDRQRHSRSTIKAVRLSEGKVPPSLGALMDGKVASPAGFNKIAMQLAALAHAVGWSATELASRCRGLIQLHKSDGNKYNTPSKREAELRRQHGYNGYPASAGGLISLFPKGMRVPDIAALFKGACHV